jgi:hypothetical protein
MKAKLINGTNSWRLEEYNEGDVLVDTFPFSDSDFAMFLNDTLLAAGYVVEVDWDEWRRLDALELGYDPYLEDGNGSFTLSKKDDK